jgi:hypothetical protein
MHNRFFTQARGLGRGLMMAAGAALALAATSVGAATQVTELTSGVQYNYAVSFAANSQSAIGVAVTPVTASGKILQIQAVSLYRYPASGSVLQCFLAVPANVTGTSAGTGYVALPDVGASSDFYPATTANITAYIPAAKDAYVNCYRTGGTSYPAETVFVTVVGVINTP